MELWARQANVPGSRKGDPSMRWLPAKAIDAEIECQSQLVRLFFIAAEKELSAFFTAVNGMFGAEQASKSAIHWVEELKSMDWQIEDSMPNWRQVTLAASARLAADLVVGTHKFS